MSNMKKLMLGISAAVISLTCAVATSAAWKVTDYDTTNIYVEQNGTHKVAVEYELYDNNGLSTGLKVSGIGAQAYGLKPYATVTYSAPAFELAYPNREYVSIFADGVDTRKVRYNGIQENLNYRWTNYGWELAAPHRIFQVKQANINGGWYADATYPTQFLGDVATVKAEYNNHYGFGYWHVENGKVTEYMPAALRAYAPNVDTGIVAYQMVQDIVTEQPVKTYAKTFAGALAPNAIVDMTAYNFDGSVNANAQYIPEVKTAFNLVVSGPSFDMNGNIASEFGVVCNAATYNTKLLDNFKVAELVKNITDGVKYAVADVEWVDAGFEVAVPYRCYQILKVDGVLLDGSVVNGTKLPYVYRYTGANANPVQLVSYKNEFLNLDLVQTNIQYWAD